MVEPTVRLYLEKGVKEDLFVDTIALPHHQNDAIRFLYRQFKKGAGGVILNDPSGSGKRVAAVLFLEAVRPIMPLPTLVLCPDGKEQQWAQLFQNWTKMGPDVCIQRSAGAGAAESVRSRCVVSAFSGWGALSRREWGALVLDDGAASREALRAAPSANYKIWITSLDMKKNLQTFSLIYKYLHPGKRFIVEDFETIKKSPSVVLASSAKLDAFMEDVVLRRRGVSVPLANTSETISHATGKNKDPTGKKTKRSKPKPADEQDTHPLSLETRSRAQQEDVPLSKTGKIMRNNSIEDFIVNVQSAVRTINDVDSIDNALPFSDFTQKPKKDDDHINITEQMSESKVKNPNKLSIQTVDKVRTNDISLNKNELKRKNDDDDYINNSESKVKNPNILSIPTVDEVKTNDINLNKNELKRKNDDDDYINNSESKVKNPIKLTIQTFDEVKTNEISDIKNELVHNNTVNEHERKLDGIESKMKQMEELAMKKFKGSFLDNII